MAVTRLRSRQRRVQKTRTRSSLRIKFGSWHKRKPSLPRLDVSVEGLQFFHRGNYYVPRAFLDLKWLFKMRVMTKKKHTLMCYCPCARVRPMPGEQDRCRYCDAGC